MVFVPLLVLALQQPPLPDSPTARSPVTLTAATAEDGRDQYVYDGQASAPVIRARPGERLLVTLVNAMTVPSRETCIMDPCMQTTNVHFHGMHVSPTGAADNVLGMLARPGDTLHYRIDIPADHPPGLYWYHPHPHGESDRQIDDGMSGAIVVDGIDRDVPAVRGLRERILVVRAPHHTWTINGVERPAIDIAPGERQFWRIVNASGDNFLDLAVDGQSWDVVALDGAVVPSRTMAHVPIPPGGRLEAIVTGPKTGAQAMLRTRAVDTGPDGDPQPAAVMADLIVGGGATVSTSKAPTRRRRVPAAARAAAHAPPAATVTFTEDAEGFYINGRRYEPSDEPMFTVPVGSFLHWRIVNSTHEIHPFHIHQVHFLVSDIWLDTVIVPADGSVDVVLDATNPVIRGLSVFHCHMIRHEDKGMMAKVLFQ